LSLMFSNQQSINQILTIYLFNVKNTIILSLHLFKTTSLQWKLNWFLCFLVLMLKNRFF
jgi:hypothetical protein